MKTKGPRVPGKALTAGSGKWRPRLMWYLFIVINFPFPAQVHGGNPRKADSFSGRADTIYFENKLRGKMAAIFYRGDNPYRAALPVSFFGKEAGSVRKLVCDDTLTLYDQSLVPFVVVPGDHLVVRESDDGKVVLESKRNSQRTDELLFFRLLYDRVPILSISREKVFSPLDFKRSETRIVRWHDTALSFLRLYGKSHRLANWFKGYAGKYLQFECLRILFDPLRYDDPKELAAEIRSHASGFNNESALSFFNFRKALYEYNELLASLQTDYPGFDALYASARQNFTGQVKEELVYRVLINFAEDEIYKPEFREAANLFLKNYRGDSLARIFGENYGYLLKNADDLERENYQSEKLFTPGDSMIEWKDLLSGFRGKIVYVDFWASWCAPCIQEIPNSFKLREQLNNAEIAFIYVSEDVGFKAWLEAIPAFRIPRTEAFLIQAPVIYSKIVAYFNIVNIPRYLIFDRNGKLVKSNAPRPSSREIRPMLESLMRKEPGTNFQGRPKNK